MGIKELDRKSNQCNALKHEAFQEIVATKWNCVSRSEKEHVAKGSMIFRLRKNFLKNILNFWFVLLQGKMNRINKKFTRLGFGRCKKERTKKASANAEALKKIVLQIMPAPWFQ